MRLTALLVVGLLAVTGAPRVLASTGGPDAFGYRWADQDESDVARSLPWWTVGPTFVGLSDEAVSAELDLGFPFPFYGATYDRVVVSDNGWLSFDRSVTDPTPAPQPLPSPGGPNATIAWFWTDLAPRWIHTYGFAEGFALHLVGDLRGAPSAPAEGWVLLYRSGVIEIQFDQVPPLAGASVGIEDAAGGVGLAAHEGGGGGFTPAGGAVIRFLPPAGLDCTGAIPIGCGDVVRSSSPPSLARNVRQYGCAPEPRDGRERLFTLRTPEIADVTLRLTPDPGLDLDLFLLDGGCHEQRCVAGGGADLTRAYLPAGDYQVAVDGLGAGDVGGFELAVECVPRATPVGCGGATLSDATSGTGRWSFYGCTSEVLDGPEAVYQVPFSGPGNLRVSLAPELGSELDLVVFGPDSLEPLGSCTWGDDSVTLFDPADGMYYVVVDGRSSPGRNQGGFDLDLGCDVLLDCSAAATELACGVTTTASTRGASARVERYSCAGDLVLDGPEVVHRFTQPQDGFVGFHVEGPAALAPLIVPASACDEASCLAFERLDNRLLADLPAGDYQVVVDGVGPGADYAITPICESVIDPPDAGWVLEAGETIRHAPEVLLGPCAIPDGDVLFAIDITGSMGTALANLKIAAQAIVTELAGVIDDVQFGLVSLRDYPLDIDSCNYGDSYGQLGDSPYTLEVPITSALPSFFAGVDRLVAGGGGDAPEAYLRAFAESYLDETAIGWRPGARRVVVMIGDDEPHSCADNACGTPRGSSGVDPGRDGVAGTADDLAVDAVMAALEARGITPIFLVADASQPFLVDFWGCWTGLANGAAYAAPEGAVPPLLVDDIRALVETNAARCNDFEVTTEPPGYAAWVRVVSAPAPGFVLPARLGLELEIGPPAGTPAGRHDFEIIIGCRDGCEVREAIAIEVGDVSLAVVWDDFGARRVGGDVELHWRTLIEEGTSVYAVERAASEGASFVHQALVAVVAPGYDYRWTDLEAPAGAWYRVVEYTVDGRGDVSRAFTAAASGGAARGGARQRRSRR